MKKIFALLMCASLFLCGCSGNTSPPTQETVESTEITDVSTAAEETTEGLVECVDISTAKEYSTVNSFQSSEFCKKMETAGFTPYMIDYDETKYSLLNIRCDATFYEFHLKELSTGDNVTVSLLYDSKRTNADEFGENVRVPVESSISTVEKDGVTYDVYTAKDPFSPEPLYTLNYLPFEGYEMYINAASSTAEDAIAAIHDFDLVSAVE